MAPGYNFRSRPAQQELPRLDVIEEGPEDGSNSQQAPTTSCEGVQLQDENIVVVKASKPLNLTKYCYVIICAPLFLGICWSPVIILCLMSACHRPPVTALEDLSIHNMAVYQNNTITTPDSQWQVTSEFNITFSAWNRNTVAGCFSTYRRMFVYMRYQGTLILQQEVLLGFGLKPRRSRLVSVELKGDHVPLTNDLGPLLEAELQISGSVGLEFYFDTQYLRNDRKAGWIHMRCQVFANVPSHSWQFGNLLGSQCS